MATQGKIYTRKVIAQLLNLSERHIGRLTDEGIIEEYSHGYYKLVPTVQGYIQHLRSQISADNEGDYALERARLTRIKREDADLDLKRKRNELHHASIVEFILTNSLMAFKAKLETLPHKLLPLLMAIPEGKDKTDRILAVLKKSTMEALSELSSYKPEDFADSSMQKYIDSDSADKATGDRSE